MKAFLLFASLISLNAVVASEEGKLTPTVGVVYYCSVNAENNYPLNFKVVTAAGAVLDSGTLSVVKDLHFCFKYAQEGNASAAQ